MHDADGVDVAERVEQAECEGAQLRHTERTALLHEGAERRAVDVLGGEPRWIGLEVGIEKTGDVVPADLLDDVDLAGEALEHRLVVGQRAPEQLDRCWRPVEVVTEEHQPHAAFAQPRLQSVRPDPRRIALEQRFRHGARPIA